MADQRLVRMPARILDRHTGGNTTYSRALADHLPSLGWKVDRIPQGRHPASTLLHEAAFGLRRTGGILHYTADTGALLKTRTPSVVTVHGIASRWVQGIRTPRQEFIWRTRVSRAIKSADRVLSVSGSSARDISAVFGLPVSQITVIPHGIHQSYFADGDTDGPVEVDLRDRLGDDPFLLYLGNLEPRKNLVALLQAYQLLVEQGHKVPRLAIAGQVAWNADETLLNLERLGDGVIRLGFVSEAEKLWLYKNCQTFIFPSLYEGFGFPVLEALAVGATVLATRRGALADVAGPAGVIEDPSPVGIAKAITDQLADDEVAERCRSQGPLWARTFTWQSSASAHAAVYEELLR